MQCFCVVCDKPASECKRLGLWGDGQSPAHHCNAKAATCKKPAGAAAAGPQARHGMAGLVGRAFATAGLAMAPWRATPLPDSDDDEDDDSEDDDSEDRQPGFGFGHQRFGYNDFDSEDEDGICSACECNRYDDEGECTGCSHMAGHLGEPVGYYGGFGGMGGYGFSTAHRLNAWTSQNSDVQHYTMSQDTTQVLQKPNPAKRIVFKPPAQDLKDSVKIGTIHFPVKVRLLLL